MMMVNKYMFIALALIATLVQGCKKDEGSTELSAAFSSAISKRTYPPEVSFSNQSRNAISYVWDFGDTTFSAERNPVHQYHRAGSYKVSLTVMGSTDTLSCEHDVMVTVYVEGNWTYEFTLFSQYFVTTASIKQDQNNFLTGSFVFPGTGAFMLQNVSHANGNLAVVSVNVNTAQLRFEGYMNGDWTAMSGLYYVNNNDAGQFTATLNP